MKKNIVIFLSALFALVSCSSDDTLFTEPKTPEVPDTPQSIIFNLSATHPDDQNASMRAVKTTWETGDVIFVFFSNQAAPKYLEMKWDGTAWVNTAKNSLALAESETGTMRAVYLPFDSDAEVEELEGGFSFSKISYSYYLTATLSYTVTGGEVSGDFQMQVPDGYVQFFLDDETATDPDAEIELREPNLTPQLISSISADCSTVDVSAQAHGAPLYGYLYDKEAKATGEKKGWLFSGVLAAGARNTATDYHFTLVKDGWQGDYYSKTFAGKTLKATGSTSRAVKLPALTSWTPITDYKPIDMGTDVFGKRIYWCSRNLGATSDFPTADTDDARHATWGDYYAWGATEPYYTANPYGAPTWKSGKTGYNWESYPFMQSGQDDWKYITKYTMADGKTEGIWYDGDTFKGDNGDGVEHEDFASYDYADDAARQHPALGGLWRIPTDEEWKALIETTSFDWVWDDTQKGYTVTQKAGTAWTDPTIFLPAAGSRNNTNLFQQGNYGYYWTSTVYGFRSYDAKVVDFHSTAYWRTEGNRSHGDSVRPVTE